MSNDNNNLTTIDIAKNAQKYVLQELDGCREAADRDEVLRARNRAFGVVQFVTNCCFEQYNEDLANWWSDEILPAFNEVIWSK